MPPAGVAVLLGLPPATVRKWRQRGLVGPVCDIATRDEGYDVGAVRVATRYLKTTRPRTRPNGGNHAN
jgi:hypothetical protein